ncbi:hypothetical protein [Paracoccus broussonetiae]|nr:hypothetical protein [Paracoccus sp. CPCC 101403]
MKPPRHPTPYPDRLLDCEEAMEAHLMALLDKAEGTGWSRAEAIASLISLCENIQLGDEANAELRRFISTRFGGPV